MRETTYYRAKESGFLDVRSSDVVFHLQAPDLIQVLSRRIQYVHAQLAETPETPDLRLREWRESDTWDEFRTAALRFSEELKKFLLQSPAGRQSLELLAAVAWHNVRRFLRCLRHVHSSVISRGLSWDADGIVCALILREDGTATPFLATTLFSSVAPRYLAHLIRLRLLLFLQYGVTPWEAKAGISHRRIAEFLRPYGYRRAWIDSAIVHLVRERMLECVEFPVDSEFAQKYELAEEHSFRASPLAVVLCRSVQYSRSYLAVAGWNLSFLDEDRYDEFVAEGRNVRDVAGEATDTPVSVALLAHSTLPDIVVSYLHDITASERLINAQMRNRSETTLVEHEIERIQRKWEEMVPDLAEALAPSTTTNSSEIIPQTTLPLFDDFEPEEAEFRAIPRPATLGSARLDGRSRTGALILWALAALRANNRNVVSGTEITNIINEYGVDDHSRVLSTNVSRTLRSELLRSKAWLRCFERNGMPPRYGLQAGWEEAWRQVFGEAPTLASRTGSRP